MRSILTSLLILSLSSTAGLAATVRGKVVDAGSNEPVAGIVVQVEHHGNRNAADPDDFSMRMVSGADGVYSIDVLSEGKQYMVLLSDEAGHIYAGFAHVAHDKDTDLGTTKLERGCALSGVIRDSNQVALPNLEVAVRMRLQRRSCKHYVDIATVTTDDDGAFEFDDLSPAEYVCETVSGSYAPERVTVKVTDDLCYIEQHLEPGCVVKGRVTGPDGNPLAGVIVSARRSGKSRTDEEGNYSLRGLTEGDQYLTVQRREYAVKENETVKVTCTADEEVVRDIEMVRAYGLSGKVTDEAGSPVKGAQVQAGLKRDDGDRRRHMRSMKHARTDADGGFKLKNVAGGTYKVKVSHDDWMPASTTVEVGEAGGQALALTMKAGLSISGIVSESDGAPVTNLHVTVSGPQGASGDDHVWKRADADADGEFTVSGLATGKYTVAVEDKKSGKNEVRLKDVEAGTDELFVALGARQEVSLLVVDGAGAPVEGAQIGFARVEGEGRRFFSQSSSGDDENVTDAAGGYKLAVRQGSRYEVTAGKHPFLSAQATLDLTEGKSKPGTELRLVLEEGCEISGTVVKAKDGSPMAGVKVHIHPESGFMGVSSDHGRDSESRRVVGGDGRFRLEGAPPGIVSVVVTKDGDSSARLATKQVHVVRGQVADVRIEIGEMGSVKGIVRAPDGKGLASARIMLYQPKSPGSHLNVESDKNGEFEINDVPAGNYIAMCFKTSGDDDGARRPKMTSVKVEGGKTVTVELGKKEADASLPAVTGTVEKNGVPFDGGQITLSPFRSEQKEDMQSAMLAVSGVKQAGIEEGGRFVLDGVEPGKYVYTVMPGKKGDESDRDESMTMFNGLTEIEGGCTNIRINLTGSTLRGTVSGGGSESSDRTFVMLLPAEGAPMARQQLARWCRTDDKGGFTLECVKPGKYELQVRGSSGGAMHQRELVIQKPVHDVDIVVEPGFGLTGKITNSTGGGVVGTMIMLVSPDSAMPVGFAMAEKDGAYSIEQGIPAGEYEIYVYKEGYAVESAKQTISTNLVFDAVLVPGGSVNVRLSGAAGLEGRVVRISGEDGTEVLRSRQSSWMGFGMGVAFVIAPTDADGATTINGLRPGKYTVSVDGVDKRASVTVKPLDEAVVELAL